MRINFKNYGKKKREKKVFQFLELQVESENGGCEDEEDDEEGM